MRPFCFLHLLLLLFWNVVRIWVNNSVNFCQFCSRACQAAGQKLGNFFFYSATLLFHPLNISCHNFCEISCTKSTPWSWRTTLRSHFLQKWKLEFLTVSWNRKNRGGSPEDPRRRTKVVTSSRNAFRRLPSRFSMKNHDFSTLGLWYPKNYHEKSWFAMKNHDFPWKKSNFWIFEFCETTSRILFDGPGGSDSLEITRFVRFS